MVTDNGNKDPPTGPPTTPPPPPPPPLVDITYKEIGAYSVNINIRRVAETQMVSVRKRNIQGRYNSVRHLQRRYPELPPFVLFQLLRVQFRNKTTRTRLRLHLKARYLRQAESDQSRTGIIIT